MSPLSHSNVTVIPRSDAKRNSQAGKNNRSREVSCCPEMIYTGVYLSAPPSSSRRCILKNINGGGSTSREKKRSIKIKANSLVISFEIFILTRPSNFPRP